jgi:uncharacterized protein (DUF924 family)
VIVLLLSVMSELATPQDVLAYWFGDAPDDPATAGKKMPLWWGHADATDAELRERFGAVHEQASTGGLDGWAATPEGRVALVVVLDQLSRNLHRGTARAFAQDPAARSLALAAVEQGEDRTRPFFHRVFLYMPFEHSERLADQERACRLFERLHDEASEPLRGAAKAYLQYARQHHDIVARFGRFPHRNAILGRPSSAEELTFLEQPGSSF